MTTIVTVIAERRLRKPTRREIDSPNCVVEGWAFGVPIPAFCSALGIAQTPYAVEQTLSDGTVRRFTKRVWTQAFEPTYAFGLGAIFYCPPLRDGEWREQLLELRLSVQILHVNAEVLTVNVTEYPSKKLCVFEIGQDELVRMLQTGEPPT